MKNNSVAPKTQMPANGILAPEYPTCPFRNVITRFGDKWSLLILYILNASQALLRFNELEKSIPDISSRVLSSCLRTLEADDLISRNVYPVVPPKVEYSLTETSLSLIPHLQALTGWAIEHFDHVIEHRAKYNRKHREK